VLTPLPLYHIFSLTANLLAFALMGGLSVLVPDPRDLKGLIRTMRRAQVTTMTGVNTLFNALINTPDFATLDFSKLSFASAAAPRCKARWRALAGDHRHRSGRRLWAHRSVAGRVHQSGQKPEARHRRPAGALDRSRHPRR
jgi:acyl-CoA synthetase (AMP-forming)/AMP-acid ligase II